MESVSRDPMVCSTPGTNAVNKGQLVHACDESSIFELLWDSDATLLAIVCSALSAQSLLRLELALGARLGGELRSSAGYRSAWVQLLARDAGLVLDTNRVTSADQLPVSSSKLVLRDIHCSTGLEGGWRGLSVEGLSACVDAIAQLHARHPDGRELLDLDTGESWGSVQRMALMHFDACGCFQDTSWDALVESFCKNRIAQRDMARCVRSSSARCVVEGLPLEFSLTLETLPGMQELRDIKEGFVFDMDLEGFRSYFVSPSGNTIPRPLEDRLQDLIHVTYILRCGEIQRHAACIIRFMPRSRIKQILDQKHLWHFVPFRKGLPQVCRLEVSPREHDFHSVPEAEIKTKSSAFNIEEDVCTAEWNPSLERGTDLVPVVWAKAHTPANEFASEPFPPRSLEGSIALIRRGGGCGFAHKTIAARNAGAVGCIIYEDEGDRETMGEVFQMGQRFGANNFPNPGIPSVLLNVADGRRVLEAVQRPGGVQARIVLDKSEKALRALSSDFQAFREQAKLGEPVHLAMLVERVTVPSRRNAQSQEDLGIPRLDWFKSLKPPGPPWPGRYMEDLDNSSFFQLGTVHVF